MIYKPDQHISQLDGVRGLAILLVTLYRFGRDLPTESTLGYLLAQAFSVGQHGVELFFVLSGFLITGILLSDRGGPHQLKNFFMRRAVRILPLYFMALVVCLWFIPALAWWSGDRTLQQAFAPAQEHQFYLWFYLTNVYMSWQDSWCFGAMDHFWSLAVEEHFYVVWPLVVCCCRPRQLVWVALCGVGLSLGLRTAWCGLGWSTTATDVHTIMRCDGLLLGALLAIQVRLPSGLVPWRTMAERAWLPLLTIALLTDFSDRRMLMLGTASWTMMWASVLVLLVTSRRESGLARNCDLPALRGLGKVSYGMYVFQAPLIPVMAWLLSQAGYQGSLDNVTAHLLYVIGMSTLTYALAWCSWHGFEKHWLSLKRYFPASASSQSVSPLPAPIQTQEKGQLSPR